MTADLVPRIFTIDVDDRPTVTFAVQSLRQARELCREHWFKEDLSEAQSRGVPLWDGKAKMRVRYARPDEATRYAEANENRQPSEDMLLLFLVELDANFD
jgi:hypothetical protein